MDFNLTAEQKKLLDTAEAVARESLEPRASKYDAEATHPIESWHDVWKAGLLTTSIPREYGGLGLDMTTYVMMIERLAWGCTSTAMTVHMHSTAQRFIDFLGTHQQKTTFFSDVVEDGRLVASWGSEPGRRGGASPTQTILSPVDDGFVINGQKHFCTMAGGAFRYLVACAAQGFPGRTGTVMALVPRDNAGMKISGGWDTLGMRGTVSPAVTFENCLVKREWVIGEPGQAENCGIEKAFGLGYSAIYIGAAQRALDCAKDFVKKNRFDPDPGTMAENSLIQRHIAEMALALESARLLTYQSASRWNEVEETGFRTILEGRAKSRATEAALFVTSRAIQVCGGRVAHKRYPLERIFRDVRTCTLMPPNVDRALESVGKAELELEL
jgi:alkylation response protein AidB-like acyl-CoA dehydrogenase